MKTTRHHAAVGAIAAALLLVTASGCGSGSDDSGAETAPTAATEATVDVTGATGTDSPNGTASATTEPPSITDDQTSITAVVPEALQFTAPLVGGGTFDGATVVGKPTVFWFWAPT